MKSSNTPHEGTLAGTSTAPSSPTGRYQHPAAPVHRNAAELRWKETLAGHIAQRHWAVLSGYPSECLVEDTIQLSILIYTYLGLICTAISLLKLQMHRISRFF